MTTRSSTGTGTLKEKLGPARRLQVWVREETYRRIKHAALERGEKGTSLLVEEALQLWLKHYGPDRNES